MAIRFDDISSWSVAFSLALWIPCGSAQMACAISKDHLTWADFHPEVAEIFKKPHIDWPCELIDTGLTPVKQPCIVMGPGNELFVGGAKGQVFHSTDLGRTWEQLCTAPSLSPPTPPGSNVLSVQCTHGIGVTNQGTLLINWCLLYNDGDFADSWNPQDDSFDIEMWMVRSEDRGRSWQRSGLFDPAPYQLTSDTSTVIQLLNGLLMVPQRVMAWPRPGKYVPPHESQAKEHAQIYTSSDDGKTWPKWGTFPDDCSENHLLELPSGKILATVRYQRGKHPDDDARLANDAPGPGEDPTAIGQDLFCHTGITRSDDGGRTWSTPRLVTGSVAQTACPIRLSDGTIIIVFGRWGQRFMLSYDDGETWSRAVYKLHHYGEYARSMVLDDDTILSIHDSAGREFEPGNNKPLRLGVVRWKAPPRDEVEKHGFFTPRPLPWGG